jgi:hypothetical protein
LFGVLGSGDRCGGEGVFGVLHDLLVSMNRLGVVRGDAVLLAERLGVHGWLGYPTMDAALAKVDGVSRRQVQGVLAGAEELAEAGVIGQAARAGVLNRFQAHAAVKALNSVKDHLPTDSETRGAVELLLVERARGLVVPQVGRLVDVVLRRFATPLQAADAVEDAADRLEMEREVALKQRCLVFKPDGDGSVAIYGSLPVVEAAELEAVVEAYSAQIRRNLEGSADRPYGQGRLFNRGALRIDALLRAIRHDRDCDGVARHHGEKPRLTVTVTLDQLQSGLGGGHLVSDPDQQPLSGGVLRRMACDAGIIPAVLGTDSAVLDLGRENRLADGPLRRALELRDGGCSFPNCFEPASRCEAHHIIPWWCGGPTTLNNLALYCPHHHALIEPRRELTPDGQLKPNPNQWQATIHQGHGAVTPPTLTDPGHQPITHQRHQTTHAAAPPTPNRTPNRTSAPPGKPTGTTLPPSPSGPVGGCVSDHPVPPVGMRR